MISALSSRVNSSAFLNARKPRLIETAVGVLLQLHAEGRHDVEGGMEVGISAEHVDHSPVIFQGVQARPGEDIASAFRVAVLRLMHVPQDNQMNPLHCSRLSRARSVTGGCPADSRRSKRRFRPDSID